MKWILLCLCLFFSSKAFSQSIFDTEEEFIEYISGVWVLDSLYSGWTGIHYIPSPSYLDSALLHLQFVESALPEAPLHIRQFINGELNEESEVSIHFEEDFTFGGHWFIEFESENFLTSTIAINETVFDSTDTILSTLHLVEFAFDANEYYFTRCNPPLADDGLPSFLQFQDEDQDGYGINENSIISCDELENYSFTAGDCNDQDESINPDAAEIPGNDIDENCDGIIGTTSNIDTEIIQIEIFPNPATDIIFIKTDRIIQYEVLLYNIHGGVIKSYNSPTQIDISNLPSGAYLIRYIIPSGKTSGIEKIVKI